MTFLEIVSQTLVDLETPDVFLLVPFDGMLTLVDWSLFLTYEVGTAPEFAAAVLWLSTSAVVGTETIGSFDVPDAGTLAHVCAGAWVHTQVGGWIASANKVVPLRLPVRKNMRLYVRGYLGAVIPGGLVSCHFSR